MKCQILFSGKIKKKYNMSSAVVFTQHEKLIFVIVYSSSKKLQLDFGNIL